MEIVSRPEAFQIFSGTFRPFSDGENRKFTWKHRKSPKIFRQEYCPGEIIRRSYMSGVKPLTTRLRSWTVCILPIWYWPCYGRLLTHCTYTITSGQKRSENRMFDSSQCGKVWQSHYLCKKVKHYREQLFTVDISLTVFFQETVYFSADLCRKFAYPDPRLFDLLLKTKPRRGAIDLCKLL